MNDINFSDFSLEEVQNIVNRGKEELRKRYYDLIDSKRKKVFDDLKELASFIAECGGDTDTSLDFNWQGITFEDCMELFGREFDPMSFFPDNFFD